MYMYMYMYIERSSNTYLHVYMYTSTCMSNFTTTNNMANPTRLTESESCQTFVRSKGFQRKFSAFTKCHNL